MWSILKNAVTSAADTWVNELFAWQASMEKGTNLLVNTNFFEDGISPMHVYMCAKVSRHVYNDSKVIPTEWLVEPPMNMQLGRRHTWREYSMYNGPQEDSEELATQNTYLQKSVWELERADRDISPALNHVNGNSKTVVHNSHPRCVIFMNDGHGLGADGEEVLDDTAYITFRGTHEGKDVGVILDHELAEFHTDNEVLLAHRGIAGKLDEIWNCIEKAIESLPRRINNIYITGHSLGGAYAQLCGARLLLSNKRLVGKTVKIKIVTFGAPLVFACASAQGNHLPELLIKALNGISYNFVFGCDMVPRLLGIGLSSSLIKMVQASGFGLSPAPEKTEESITFQSSYFNPSLKQFSAIGSMYYMDAPILENESTFTLKRFREHADVSYVGGSFDTAALVLSPARALQDHSMTVYLVALRGLCRRTSNFKDTTW
eukprot:CFRG3474T1